MNRIFLVDDDEDDRMFTRQALESIIENCGITELSDGNELLFSLQQQMPGEPSMVLIDMNMPRMNGLEALTAIRNNPDLCHIPVVMISTSANPESVKKAYELGVNAYIVKPTTYNDYLQIANAVNLCFLNNYPSTCSSLKLAEIERKNVLVIEDNMDHYALMEFHLRQNVPQINLIHKSTAEEAVEYLDSSDDKAAKAIDLILLDLYLPSRKQGLDLLTRIRAMSGLGHCSIPVVVISASGDPRDIRASYRSRANAYLVKTRQPAKGFSYLADLCYFWQHTIVSPAKAR